MIYVTMFLCLSFLSCGQITNNETSSTEMPNIFSTLTNNSDSIVIVDNENRIIKWKFKGMENYLKDTLSFPIPSLNNHKFEWKSDDFISLKVSCGSTCWFSYLFPLKLGVKEKKVNRFMYSVGFDYSRNLIAYIPDNFNEKHMLRIENIGTGEKVDIERQVCPAAMTFLCIEELSFNKDTLVILWNVGFFNDSELNLLNNESVIAIPAGITSKNRGKKKH